MSSPNLPSGKEPSLLTPTNNDDDGHSIHSEQDTDSEDDSVLRDARTSADIRKHDRSVLFEEEERDRILTENRQGRRGSGLSLPNPFKKILGKTYEKVPHDSGTSSENLLNNNGSGKREKRRQREARRHDKRERLLSDASNGEDRELTYEMEEGSMKEGSATGESSDTDGLSDVDKMELHNMNEQARRRRRWGRLCYISALILLAFVLLVLGAWKLSMGRRTIPVQVMFNNGSALFAPTTILISLDGFRADFLQRGITPRLNAFVAEGVSPVYMSPSFPSVTFPNHYTLVTGLYPESHGIVGNSFWDPVSKKDFFYTDPSRSMQREWWGGEPIWATAEKQGIRTAIHMWPGSEAHISDVEPSFLDKYKGKEPLLDKVDRVLELLDKPGQEDESVLPADMRPQLIAAYVPNVDSDGHKYGPNSTEMRATISSVDNMLDQLFIGLEKRNLTQVVNVVVVSDHGMASTSTDRLIQIDDLIDLDLIERTEGWPLYGLRPKFIDDLQGLYETLVAAASASGNFEVYLRDLNMPERYHFSKNERIAPLWIVPNTGWAIVTKEEFDVVDAKAKGTDYRPKGLHGYDHENPLMRAIFVARGPAFPHSPNSRVEPFQNIEVYNIICDSLNLTPQPNNGTLRLPLKPIGVHSPETTPEEPSDPMLSTKPSASVGIDKPISVSSSGIDRPIASEAPDVDRPVISAVPTETSDIPNPSRPVISVVSTETSDISNTPRPTIIAAPTETPIISSTPISKTPGDTPDSALAHMPTASGGSGESGGSQETGGNFWDFLRGKVEGIKDWFGELVSNDNKAGEDKAEKRTESGWYH